MEKNKDFYEQQQQKKNVTNLRKTSELEDWARGTEPKHRDKDKKQ